MITILNAKTKQIICFLVLINFLLLQFALCDEYSHKYEIAEPVVLWASQVGPHYNPQETYSYYEYPFCKPDSIDHKSLSLGEALQGLEQVKASNLEINFRENVFKKPICPMTFTESVSKKLLYAVKHQYWYQFFIDELPMWAMVGGIAREGEKNIPFVFAHKKFSIGFNKNHIVEVNLTAENPVPIKEGNPLVFTYSVNWIERTDIEFYQRFRKYLDFNFFEHKIHWFSIFNSFMMVIFLAVLVFMILIRTLRSDLAQYKSDLEDPGATNTTTSVGISNGVNNIASADGADSDSEFLDESGWKQIKGDVFRAPPFLELYAALIGTGYQLMILIFCLITFAILGSYYDTRGAVLTSFIVLYSISSMISGYFSGSCYLKYQGKNWIRTMFLTACFFPGFCFLVAFCLNFVAIAYNSLAAIPFGTMLSVLAMWFFITVPLVLLGTIVGRSLNGKTDFPCRVSQYPRPIPLKPWYLNRWVFVALGGLLPFGSIFIEMYFIFTSFWNYKFYYVYGFMMLVYVILIIVTICVSIVSTYLLLNAEDHRWHWTTFLASSSTAIYVFIYAVYFFYFKTKMKGLFQVSFYFGYTTLFCFGLGVLCGAIGFIGTNAFIRRIYRDIKSD